MTLNFLLKAELDDILSRFPKAPEVVAARLKENEQRFFCRTGSVATEVEFNSRMREKVLAIEAALAKLPVWRPLHDKDGLKNSVRYIYSLCPQEKKRGLFLKESVASEILHEMPPAQLLAHVPKKEVNTLSPLSILAITRFTETKEWQDAYLERLSKLSARHFIERDIRCLVVDSNAFEGVLKLAGEKQKPWRISHNKETGIISCFTLDEAHALPAPLTQCLAVFMHYFFEIVSSSESANAVARKHPEKFGAHLKSIIRSHAQKFEFFHPNTYSEHLFWERATDLMVASFPDIEELQFFQDTIDCGGYVDDAIVSLNLIDHIWNVNLAGQAATKTYFGDAHVSFLYHFREGLWYDLFRLLLGLTREEMREATVQSLHQGDKPFTAMMLEKYT